MTETTRYGDDAMTLPIQSRLPGGAALRKKRRGGSEQ
jgi:hypothetical protein